MLRAAALKVRLLKNILNLEPLYNITAISQMARPGVILPLPMTYLF